MPNDRVPPDPSGTPHPLGSVTTYVYDGTGRVIRACGPPGPIAYTTHLGEDPVGPP